MFLRIYNTLAKNRWGILFAHPNQPKLVRQPNKEDCISELSG
nr:MAG TPA: hypothetical protein [Inoviridae sp.]